MSGKISILVLWAIQRKSNESNKNFTLSSGAQVDDDDEAEIDEDPEAKNQLEKNASVMLPTFLYP